MFAKPVRVVILCAFALSAASAPAREVYKCTTPRGDVAYQDKPCAGGTAESTIQLAEPPAHASPAPPAPTVAAEPAPKELERPTPPPHPARPLPEVWFCTNAEDGKPFVSVGGLPPPRSVPLGTLGYPGRNLSDAYRAGANVMSAPELSKPPIASSPGSQWANQYTEVQDYCVAADFAQTCAYLRQKSDETGDKLRRARFKDEQAKLQGELDALEADLGGC